MKPASFSEKPLPPILNECVCVWPEPRLYSGWKQKEMKTKRSMCTRLWGTYLNLDESTKTVKVRWARTKRDLFVHRNNWSHLQIAFFPPFFPPPSTGVCEECFIYSYNRALFFHLFYSSVFSTSAITRPPFPNVCVCVKFQGSQSVWHQTALSLKDCLWR